MFRERNTARAVTMYDDIFQSMNVPCTCVYIGEYQCLLFNRCISAKLCVSLCLYVCKYVINYRCMYACIHTDICLNVWQCACLASLEVALSFSIRYSPNTISTHISGTRCMYCTVSGFLSAYISRCVSFDACVGMHPIIYVCISVCANTRRSGIVQLALYMCMQWSVCAIMHRYV